MPRNPYAGPIWRMPARDPRPHDVAAPDDLVQFLMARVDDEGADAVLNRCKGTRPRRSVVQILLDLVQPYKDHPDFREEWRA